MTDGSTPVSQILKGIDEARRARLGPVKINMVVQRGVNEHAILPMAEWARREQLELRFIEYMDVGCSNGWRLEDVLTASEIQRRIDAHWPLEPVVISHGSGRRSTAERYRYRDGAGFIGLVASITRPFCGDCTRARVSSHGELFPCLFAPRGVDLAMVLRRGGNVTSSIGSFWANRTEHYSEIRGQIPEAQPRPEMCSIGG